MRVPRLAARENYAAPQWSLPGEAEPVGTRSPNHVKKITCTDFVRAGHLEAENMTRFVKLTSWLARPIREGIHVLYICQNLLQLLAGSNSAKQSKRVSRGIIKYSSGRAECQNFLCIIRHNAHSLFGGVSGRSPIMIRQ